MRIHGAGRCRLKDVFTAPFAQAARRAPATVLSACLAILAAAIAAPLPAQDIQHTTTLTGGVGLSWIGGHAYYNVQLRPEFALGNLGAGLNIDLLVDSNDGHIRSEDLKFAKLLRYIRYAHPGDPFYGRIGALDAASLGHGLIVGGYQNQLVENRRKLGLELATRQPAWELQLLTNNLGRSDLFGARGAVAPLRDRVRVPLLSRIRTGGTVVYERDEDEGRLAGTQDVTAVGADLELPLTTSSRFLSRLYFDWARLRDHGSGRALGVSAESHGLPGLGLAFRLERRWSGAHFRPRYFDFAYEIERFNPATGTTRAESLDSLAARNDVLGELSADVVNLVRVTGSYEVPDVRPRLGLLHLDGALPGLRVLDLSANYDRRDVRNGRDLFRLDDRSTLTARAGYPLNRWLRFGVEYEWTFRWESAEQRYRTVRKVTPTLYASGTF